MDESSFAAVKPGLEEACEFLQAFTLARPGFTDRTASPASGG